MNDREQMAALAEPFPAEVIKPPAPGKYGDYVQQQHYERRLDEVLGPENWSAMPIVSELGVTYSITITLASGRQVVRGDVAGQEDRLLNKETNCTIPDYDGNRLKSAATHAFKRACARFGLGRHLYEKTGRDPASGGSGRQQDGPDVTMRGGKHKGLTPRQIVAQHRDYAEWWVREKADTPLAGVFTSLLGGGTVKVDPRLEDVLSFGVQVFELEQCFGRPQQAWTDTELGHCVDIVRRLKSGEPFEDIFGFPPAPPDVATESFTYA